MIKAIELENFKAFGERTRIECAPITLFFGQNSAGKTSILQALSLLKQTREAREFGAPLLPRGDIVDLGSFQELLFDHNLNRELRIGVVVSTESTIEFPLYMKGDFPALPDSVGLTIAFRRPTPAAEVEISSFEVSWGGLAEPLVIFEPKELSSGEQREGIYIGSRLRRRRSREITQRSKLRGARCVRISKDRQLWEPCYLTWLENRREVCRRLRDLQKDVDAGELEYTFTDQPPDPRKLKARSDEVKKALSFYSSQFSLSQFINRLTRGKARQAVAMEGFLPRRLRTLGRWYLPEMLAVSEYGRHGSRDTDLPSIDIPHIAFAAGIAVEEVLDALFPMGPFRRPPERWYIFPGTSPEDVGYGGDRLPDLLFRNAALVDRANEWIKHLELGYELCVRPIGEKSSDLFEVRFIDKARSSPVDVGLTDVGFGISQILPFLVQCFAAERQVISIEQPEVHIHPKLQADLGDLLAMTIREPHQHQFLIETHSEHLILRLQKLIRHGKLTPEDVSIIFVSRGPNGSRAQRLRLDEDGDFADDWPGGFFAERLRELR